MALAALLSAQSANAQNGTWLGVSGNWNASGTWSGGIIADGAGSTANFTGVNITAARTITFTTSQTNGNIPFTDATISSHDLAINSRSLAEILLLSLSSEVAGTLGLTSQDRFSSILTPMASAT